jgi:hypothetical protein
MSAEHEPSPKTSERLVKLYRNFNIIGAVALGGLAIITPVGAPVLATLAGINALQAGGAEAVLQYSKKRSSKDT